MASLIWPPEAVAHMWEGHEVTQAEAEEAVSDPDALERFPDPASASGKSARWIGYSASRNEVLCVIVIHGSDGTFYGANAWPANPTHERLYRERQNND